MRLAIIPARGGSVRVPRKNIRPFFGKPIITYSIAAAKESGLFDQIVVSTDDAEIAEVARSCGVDSLMRPDGWDDFGTQDVAGRVVEAISPHDTILRHACVIYATSPMLTHEDLQGGYRAMVERNALFVMAVGAEPLRDAGMFYWGEGWAFVRGVPLISPRTAMYPIPEYRVCDINTEEDWQRAERMYAGRIQEAAKCVAS